MKLLRIPRFLAACALCAALAPAAAGAYDTKSPTAATIKFVEMPYSAMHTATADFVKTHLDVVRRFAAVIGQTARWANANQSTTAKILEKLTGVSPAGLAHRVHYHDHLDATAIQPLVNAAAKYGTLKAPFPAADIIAQGL